jgi:putative DNA-invertase from lambdoid prophage Rac
MGHLLAPGNTVLFRARIGKVQMGQRAALSCRVSTADQSCERQERDLLAFADRAGYDVVAVFKETASGSKEVERGKVLTLVRARQIGVVLVTELARWGRPTTDLLSALQELEACGVSVIAQTGLQFDLRSPQGKLFASLMAVLAEFERDLLRERIRSGVASAQERGVKFGRRPGVRVKADRYQARVLKLREEGCSYRQIARDLGLSENTGMEIVHRQG